MARFWNQRKAWTIFFGCRVARGRGEAKKIFLSILHVTLANWQRFGFEFHLRSSPSAYSGFVNISRPAEYFTACYTVLKKPNKVETAVWLSVWTLSCRCQLSISLASLFTSLSIFGWSDLLQILRKQAAFSFAVLCIIMFCCSVFFCLPLLPCIHAFIFIF